MPTRPGNYADDPTGNRKCCLPQNRSKHETIDHIYYSNDKYKFYVESFLKEHLRQIILAFPSDRTVLNGCIAFLL